MGQGEDTLAEIRFQVAPAEDLFIERFPIAVAGINFGLVQYLRLVDEFGDQVGLVVSSLTVRNRGLALGGGAVSICLDPSTGGQDDSLKGQIIRLRSGAGANQVRQVVAYHVNGNNCGYEATVYPPFDFWPDHTTEYELGGLAVFSTGNGEEPYRLTRGSDISMYLIATINRDGISNASITPMVTNTIGAERFSSLKVMGVDSNAEIFPAGLNARGTTHTIHRSVITDVIDRTEGGTGVGGSGQTVFRWLAVTNNGGHVNYSPLEFLTNGSVPVGADHTVVGMGSAAIYNAQDLGTPLAVRHAVRLSFVDNNGADGGNETSFQVNDNPMACASIPVGSTIYIWDGGPGGVTNGPQEVSAISTEGGDCEIFLTPNLLPDLDNGDVLEFLPALVGNGVGALYFGGNSTLTADLLHGSRVVHVASTRGFAAGETVFVHGYCEEGVLYLGYCLITGITSATRLRTEPCVVSNGGSIDAEYLAPEYTHHFTRAYATTLAFSKEEISFVDEFILKMDTSGYMTNDVFGVTMLGSG